MKRLATQSGLGRAIGIAAWALVALAPVERSFAADRAPGQPAAAKKQTTTNDIDRTFDPQRNVTTKQERMDRAVDVAAVASRETAIANLKRMLKLKKGTSEEPGLLWRLADMEWRASKGMFRVGVSGGEKSAANVRFTELLNSVIEHTTELLVRFPKFKDISEALLRRGRAYEDLKKKDLALRDYLDYIARYPNSGQIVSVRLMASDVLAEMNKHEEILRVLKPVDLTKSHGGLVWQVVERQAMANFNIGNYPEALRKAEWLLSYDRRQGLAAEKGGHYEDVIAMVALYYGTAFEKRVAGYSLEHAFDYFAKLESGAILGRLSHDFVLVMRTKEMQAEVVAWKDLFLEKAPNKYETLWVLVDGYDSILNWKLYPKFAQIERDFDQFFRKNPSYFPRAQKEEYFVKFKKYLLEFADKLYATLPKKEPSEADFKVIEAPYLLALSTYMRISDGKDELKARVRFRMGEFYSSVKRWDQAQQAFTEVYNAKQFVVPQDLRDQAKVRAMTARFDYFREKGVIPKDLKAGPLNSPKKPLPADVAEWIRWVDESSLQLTTGPQVETMDQLLFEANRVVYVHSDIDLAYKRMLNYVTTRPNSKLTPGTCALIMDTLISSEAWVATRTLAIRFQKMPNVAVGEFKKKLVQLERDSHFKITQLFYKNKQYPQVVQMGEEHLKLYPDTERKVDLYAMMGKAALELKQPESALGYMNEVIRLAPNHESIGIAYMIRAQSEERAFLFKEAFEDYSRVYKLPAERRGVSEADLPNLKRKLFVLGLTSDDAGILKRIAEGPEFCGDRKDETLRLDCEKLQAVRAANDDSDRRTAWDFASLGDRASGATKSAWYAAALSRGHQLPNSVITHVVDEFVRNFGRLDPVTQMEVMTSLHESVPRLYFKKVETVEKLSAVDRRIALLKDSLEKRVRETTGLEKLAGSLVALPSPEIRVKLLGRLSQAYRKVAEEIGEVRVPRDFKPEEADVLKQALANFIQPLQTKADLVGKQAWEVAKKFVIETPWMDPGIREAAGEAYKDNEFKLPLADNFLRGLKDKEPDHPWAKAVKNRQLRPMIFFYQYSQTPQAEHLGLSEDARAMLQWASLYQLDLVSEMVSSIKEAQKGGKLGKNAERFGLMAWITQGVLAQHYDEIKVARTAFLTRGYSDDNREEDRVLKIARVVDEKFTAMIVKAEEEAKAKQKAEEEAKKAAAARQPAQQTPPAPKSAPKQPAKEES